MGLETEIKFHIPESELVKEITRDVFLLEKTLRGKWQTMAMEALYYDTQSLDLQKAGIVFRVRREGEVFTATVKQGGRGESHIQQRKEWNVNVQSLSPRIEAFVDTEIGSQLKELAGSDSRLQVLFYCSFSRDFALLDLDEGTQAEIAMDTGEIVSGRLKEPICELELELKRGQLAVMEGLASVLSAKYGLLPEPRSKFSRGLSLFKGLYGC